MKKVSKVSILFLAVFLLLVSGVTVNAITDGVRVSTPDTCWYQGSFFNMPVEIEWTKWSKYIDYCPNHSIEYDVPPPADACADNYNRCRDCGAGDNTMCSFQMEIRYNPAVIQAVTVTPSVLMQSWNWAVPYFEINNGTGSIKIAAAGGYCPNITNLTDPTALIYIGFQINGGPGAFTNFRLESFQYNEVPSDFIYFGNNDVAGYDDAKSIGDFEICAYQELSGRVTYCANGRPICDADVMLEYQPADPNAPAPGINTLTTQTQCDTDCGVDCRGTYMLTEVIGGYDYCLSVWKNDEYDNAITAFDASLILRYVVNMLTFIQCQEIAADVSGDCTVSAYDASLIMQSMVGQFTYFPKNRADNTNWIFFESNSYPRYLCPDEEMCWYPLPRSFTDLDFSAMVLGDVSGNWNPYTPKTVAGTIDQIAFNVVRNTENEIVLSVSLDDNFSAYSGQFDVSYPGELTFVNAAASADNSDWRVITKNDNGILSVACAGITPTSKSIVELIFIKEGASPDFSKITIGELMVDESVFSGTIPLKQPSQNLLPTEFSLGNNYPNPFNPVTNISFDLPTPSNIQVTVFNLLGQKVRSLASGYYEAGNHTVTWDATDDTRSVVASGVYFYQLRTDNLTLNKKMVLMK